MGRVEIECTKAQMQGKHGSLKTESSVVLIIGGEGVRKQKNNDP